MRVRMRLLWVLSALLAVGACTPSTTPSASDAVSAAPSTNSAPAGNLPPGCTPIDLRTPFSGERIVLDGAWNEVDTTGQVMTWWIRTQGNCVWGAGYIEDVSPEGTVGASMDDVQSLAGVLEPDFVITGEIVFLGAISPGAPGNPPRYSPLRMLVEFGEAGEILLREDREPGVSGVRCPAPGGYCPAPLVLQRVD